MTHTMARGAANSVFIALIFIVAGGIALSPLLTPRVSASLERFDSCPAIADAFREAGQTGRGGYGIMEDAVFAPGAMTSAQTSSKSVSPDYSRTNVQVEGVDEADIVKADGKYIYAISGNVLRIVEAYPAEGARILSETTLENFSPQEMFINSDRLLVFGNGYESGYYPGPVIQEGGPERMAIAPDIYPYYRNFASIRVYDISDRKEPKTERSVDFEGSYVSSRKIGSDVYFVINSYPEYRILETNETTETIVPRYRDSSSAGNEFSPATGCGDVAYFSPLVARNFLTVGSISMSDPGREVEKEIIVGSGSNVYASAENLYIAEAAYDYIPFVMKAMPGGGSGEKTMVHKFALRSGKINYKGHMEAPGTILNQFSMDEHQDHFRIATTKRPEVFVAGVGDVEVPVPVNNVYVFGENLNITGSLEGLAPGETIFSVRFMGDRAYMVTFKKIDPLFVIDLSDAKNPRVLGKLKIPGFSDYLHPYDESHIIGVGKEAAEAKEGDFAWYQGLKMALFDVSDVENPEEVAKVVIGDRGTDSPALHNHKAFLFDREKNLLVIPVLLAEIKGGREKLQGFEYGEYVWQGAYVFGLTPQDGFVQKGRITHYEDDEAFRKSGYYFGDYGLSIERSLYIGDVLYTISSGKIKLNSLADAAEIGELDFEKTGQERPYYG